MQINIIFLSQRGLGILPCVPDLLHWHLLFAVYLHLSGKLCKTLSVSFFINFKLLLPFSHLF